MIISCPYIYFYWLHFKKKEKRKMQQKKKNIRDLNCLTSMEGGGCEGQCFACQCGPIAL